MRRTTVDRLVVAACLLGIGLVGAIIGINWFSPAHATVNTHASSAWERTTGGAIGTAIHQTRWVQPYGGCAEAWQAPFSKGAGECRHHGWIVRPRLVVGPQHWIRYTRLPHCAEEDGSGQASACTWNVGRRLDGNGHGKAYWVGSHDFIHYVRGIR